MRVVSDKNVSAGIVIERLKVLACPKCQAEIDVSELEPFSTVECPACGHSFVVPGKLDDFLLLGVIGSGGMGAVYHARDESLGRDVAIKVMLQSLGDNKEFVDNFRREAQAAAKLNHPHIAQIYSFGQASGQPYIVMEMVSGERFDEMVSKGEPLDQKLVMDIGLSIAEGLSEGADIGLIHGDIKPENILLDARNQAKLIDFGIATVAEQEGAEGIWGTPYYIAPEKVRGQKVDFRADIYSLGASLYHALAGKPPFDGETPVEVVKARLESEPPLLHEIRKDVDSQVERIIARMLQAAPGERYPTYKSLISDMRKYLDIKGPELHEKKKNSKIVIRKTTRPPKIPALAGLEGVKEETEKKPRRNWAPVLKKILFGLLILGLLAGLGYAGKYWIEKREQRLEERRIRYALFKAREKAENLNSAIQRSAEITLKIGEALPGPFGIVSNALKIVTGDVMPMPKPPALAAEPHEETGPKPRDAGKEAAPTETGQADDDSKPPDSQEGSPEVAGEEKGIEAETEARESEAVEDSADGSEAEEAHTDVEPKAENAQPPFEISDDMPRIKKIALAVWEDTVTAVANVRRAEAIASESFELKAESEETSDPDTAGRDAKLLDELLVEIEDIKDDTRSLLENIREDSKRADIIRLEYEREQAELIARKKKEQELAAKQAAMKAEQERLAELAKEEKARALTAYAQVIVPLQQKKYEEAVETLKENLSDYETQEGRTALETYIKRAELLLELKLFLIDRLNEDPFSYGLGFGASARDIKSADTNGIRAKGIFLSWEDVGVAQMLKFFRRYLRSEKVDVGKLSRMNLAAAVYCLVNGGEEAADRFGDQAVDYAPHLEEDIERILTQENPLPRQDNAAPGEDPEDAEGQEPREGTEEAEEEAPAVNVVF